MTRSLPPRQNWAPVVLANSGPHISAASSATSWLRTSTFSTFLLVFLDGHAVVFRARGQHLAAHAAVAKTAFGSNVWTRIPSHPFERSNARELVSAAFEAE